MGVGPAYAIPRVLDLAGLTLNDIDFFEINEAFASQAVFSVQHLGIPWEKVNINGGAIAIGHPLGCSAYLFEKTVYLLTSFFFQKKISWCSSSCDGHEYCQANWWKGICYQHVYWQWYGHGCHLRF